MHQTQCTIKKNQVNTPENFIQERYLISRIILFRVLKLWSGLKIIFDPTVEVAESTRIHTPLSVLSNIGGFLGLCLGYSLLDGGRVLKILSECFNRSSRLNCQDQTPGKIQEAVV